MSDFNNHTNNNQFKNEWRRFVSEHTIFLSRNLNESDHVAVTLDASENGSSCSLFEKGFRGHVKVIQKDKTVISTQMKNFHRFDTKRRYQKRFHIHTDDIVRDYDNLVTSWVDRRGVKLWNFDFDVMFDSGPSRSLMNILRNAHQSICYNGTAVALTFVLKPSEQYLRLWEQQVDCPALMGKVKLIREEMRKSNEGITEDLVMSLNRIFGNYPCVTVDYDVMDDDARSGFQSIPGVWCSDKYPVVFSKNPNDNLNSAVIISMMCTLHHDPQCIHDLNPDVDRLNLESSEDEERLKLVKVILANEDKIFRDCNIRNFQKRCYHHAHHRTCTMCGKVQSSKTDCQCLEMIIQKIIHPKQPILYAAMDSRQSLRQTERRFEKYITKICNMIDRRGFPVEWKTFLKLDIQSTTIKFEDEDILARRLRDGAIVFILQNKDRLTKFLSVAAKAAVRVYAVIDEADILFPCLVEDLDNVGSERAVIFYNYVICDTERFHSISLYTGTPQNIFLADDTEEKRLSDHVIEMEYPDTYVPLENFPIKWKSLDVNWTGEDSNIREVIDDLFITEQYVKSFKLQPQLLINLSTCSTACEFAGMRQVIFDAYPMERYNLIVYDGENKVAQFERSFLEGMSPSRQYETLEDFYDEQMRIPLQQRFPIIVISSKMASRAITFCSENGSIRITSFCYDISGSRSDVNIMQEQRYAGCYDMLFEITIFCSVNVKERIQKALIKNNDRISEMANKQSSETGQDIMTRANYNDKYPLVNPRMMRRFKFSEERSSERLVLPEITRKEYVEEMYEVKPKFTERRILDDLQQLATTKGLATFELMTRYEYLLKPDFMNYVSGDQDTEKFSASERSQIKMELEKICREDFSYAGRVKIAYQNNTKANMEINPYGRRIWKRGNYHQINFAQIDMVGITRKHFDHITGSDRINIVMFNQKYDESFQFKSDVLYAYHRFDGMLNVFHILSDASDGEAELNMINDSSFVLTKDEEKKPFSKKKKSSWKPIFETMFAIRNFIDHEFPRRKFDVEILLELMDERQEIRAPKWTMSRQYCGTNNSSIVINSRGDPRNQLQNYLKFLLDQGFLIKEGRKYRKKN